MTDYSELKRLATRIVEVQTSQDVPISKLFDEFDAATSPEVILALIGEKDAMAGLLKRFVAGEHEQDENQAERHMYFTEAQSLLALVSGELEAHTIVPDLAIKAIHVERDQLRAEVAGLRTGYEAYERVNAELKAEVGALRDDLEQKQYDANAWRNSEESVWIEVFNSEGDDPFISAVTGQITVEQLALIQSEIIEYREDYFEKGSGLYVFRCAHYQAHYDNVGMTEPAHWETDFESYSPFPWEEEAAAMANGGQS